MRSTYSVSCRSLRDLPVVSDMWEQCLGLPKPCHQCLWVGRTVFNRREFFAPCTSSPGLPGNVPATGMQMTRAELLSEAQRLGLAPHPNWTAVELRSAITEVTAETKTTSLPKGLSSMRLQELKDEAMKVGLPIPEKATRRGLDAEHQGLPCHAKYDGDDDRQTQGQHPRASPEGATDYGRTRRRRRMERTCIPTCAAT